MSHHVSALTRGGPRTGYWTELIDDICAGTWINPLTGKQIRSSFDCRIFIEESLDSMEAELVLDLGLRPPFAVVSDTEIHTSPAARLIQNLLKEEDGTQIILDCPHADMSTIRKLTSQLADYNSAIAVGSGTINDLVKFSTHQLRRPYCVFATAGSMNGYTSSTASITLDSGLKVSLPAHLPAGFFVDLQICAAAPARLNAAGFGDSLCRSVAQIDWWMSHRLLGTEYRHEPYLIEIPDELQLVQRAAGIPRGDIDAIGTLFRVLTLCGLGITFTGVSNHGSMGEHQISHYIDCFAGERHPGSLHGEQVGVATLTMARIQQHLLAGEKPPKIKPVVIDFDDMARRMGPDIAAQCREQRQKKAIDPVRAEQLNAKLEQIWPELRAECREFAIPVDEMRNWLETAGGKTTAKALGIHVDLYREAVMHAHEMRDRFSFADLAGASEILDALAAAEE